MKMLKRLNAMMLMLAMVLVVGCGKDDPKPVTEVNKCVLIKKDDGSDISSFKYDSNGRLTKIEVFSRPWNDSMFIYKIEYNAAGKTDRVDKFESGSKNLSLSTTYHYNARGLLSEVRNIPVYNNYETFEYDSNNRLIKKNFFTQTRKYKYSTFTYLSNIQVKEEIFAENNGSFLLVSINEWMFGTTKHPMSGFGYLEGHISNTVLLSDYLVVSSRHPKSLTAFYDVTMDYTYNAEGYPLKEVALIDGNPVSEIIYDFDCL